MRDNLRRSRALRRSLTQGYPGEPTGHVTRHLNTLAARISGMVARKRTPLPTIATQVPDGAKPARRVTRCARWVGTDLIIEALSLRPSAELVLVPLALPMLGLVIEGRGVGRGGMALMMPVVSQGRALPVAWRVRHGKKGHFPASRPLAVVEQGQESIPEGASVVLRGEGEGDGIALPQTLEDAGWCYGCRTAMSLTASWQKEPWRLDTLGACSKPGPLLAVQEGRFTGEASGPSMLLCGWAKGDQAPR